MILMSVKLYNKLSIQLANLVILEYGMYYVPT